MLKNRVKQWQCNEDNRNNVSAWMVARYQRSKGCYCIAQFLLQSILLSPSKLLLAHSMPFWLLWTGFSGLNIWESHLNMLLSQWCSRLWMWWKWFYCLGQYEWKAVLYKSFESEIFLKGLIQVLLDFDLFNRDADKNDTLNFLVVNFNQNTVYLLSDISLMRSFL